MVKRSSVMATLVASVWLHLAGSSIAADYSATEVAEFYVTTTFGTEFPLYPELEGRVIRRFPLDAPIQVFTFTGRILNEDHIKEAKAELSSVTAELERRGENVKFDVLSDVELLWLSADKDAALKAMSRNALLVYVLTKPEIVDTANRLGEGSVLKMLIEPFLGSGNAAGVPICFAYFNAARTDSPVITTATVVAEYDETGLSTCLYEEIMQSFGMTDDFPAGVESIFNDDRVFTAPTTLDWMLWGIHTDHRIVPGMDRNAAHEVSLTIAGELLSAK